MNLNLFVTVLSWFSVFLLSWMLILEKTPNNFVSWGFFGFYLGVACVSGLYSASEKKQ
jgi:hypothetical protein